MSTEGFFIDWDGYVRSVNSPGNGYTCNLVENADFTSVDVLDSCGEVIYEAVYYRTLDSLNAAMVNIGLYRD